MNSRNYCWNPALKLSTFYSYKYGFSELFSISNVRYMEKFYKCFPIYYDELNKLTFEHYKLLVNVSDVTRRYFYYRVALFCRSSVVELRQFIGEDMYLKIKKDNNFSCYLCLFLYLR